MSQTVISFKLLSGEEVMGRLVEELDTIIKLEKVRSVQMVQQGPQQMGMAIIPYSATNIDGVIPFRKTALSTDPMTPSDETEKLYMQQTTTIALAP